MKLWRSTGQRVVSIQRLVVAVSALTVPYLAVPAANFAENAYMSNESSESASLTARSASLRCPKPQKQVARYCHAIARRGEDLERLRRRWHGVSTTRSRAAEGQGRYPGRVAQREKALSADYLATLSEATRAEIERRLGRS